MAFERRGRRGDRAIQGSRSLEDLTRENIETIAQLEQAMLDERTATDRVADAIAGFCGSVTFVWVHVCWFALWALINTLPISRHIDPFPFPFLTLVTSLEAIFLTTFVLISQNRQGRTAERRNHLELQINLLAEQETSKILQMLSSMMRHMDIRPDHEATALQAATRPEKLVEQIGEVLDIDSENLAGGRNG